MQKKGAFDHILLETTGLADPGPIASMFWQNEEYAMGLGSDIVLDGVICVVDAVFGPKQMEEDHAGDTIGESLRQVAGSDVILLNKIDLVSEAAVSSFEETIHKVNPVAHIYRTVRGEIDLKHIMGISAYTSPPQVKEKLIARGQTIDQYHAHNHDEHDHDHATHYEIRGITSLQVTCPVFSASKLEAFDEWIRSVLWENRIPSGVEIPDLQVLRCKGLFVTGDGDQYVLQGVRSIYEINKVSGETGLGLPDVGKFVLIGKGLGTEVRQSLEKLLYS
ncbi:hypothetical protein MPER_05145 [Moniliophthora perniciosa FA553]|nr:hypothetical protein MPER_05145 [Moniliophthora perniciosa FA553]